MNTKCFYTIQITDDQKEWYKNQLDENRSIYLSIISNNLPNDIAAYSDAVTNKYISEGDALSGLVVGKIMHDNWTRVEYRVLIAWISLTYQLWEQQLVQWICDIIDQFSLRNYGFRNPENMKDIRSFLNPYGNGIDQKQLSSWETIREMCLIVDVIKHAEGNAERELRKKNPQLFIKEMHGIDSHNDDSENVINVHHTSIGIPALNINSESLEKYTDALKKFWDDISEQIITVNIKVDSDTSEASSVERKSNA